MAKIRNRLSAVLGERRISVKELERMTGVSYPSLLALYHERSEAITFNVMVSICIALKLGVGDLFYVAEDDYSKEQKGNGSGED